MLLTNKLLPVALIAALIGGSVGAFVMHSSKDQSGTVATAQDTTRTAADAQYAQYQPTSDQFVPAEFKTPAEQMAYKSGFADGFRSCQSNTGLQATTVSPTRVVYGRRGSARRVYYDYRPRGRSFWQKHRDKLTLAIGTGAGAAIGGLIGGKKGAGIGALAGLGGSALYTYKLRNRRHRY